MRLFLCIVELVYNKLGSCDLCALCDLYRDHAFEIFKLIQAQNVTQKICRSDRKQITIEVCLMIYI